MSDLTGVELSNKVAELYGIQARFSWTKEHSGGQQDDDQHWETVYSDWLHEDSKRCFELMAIYEISAIWIGHVLHLINTQENAALKVRHTSTTVNLELGDWKITCLRTGVLQCLVKIKEQS